MGCGSSRSKSLALKALSRQQTELSLANLSFDETEGTIHDIEISDAGFSPESLTLHVGDHVRWSWRGTERKHNVMQVALENNAFVVVRDGFKTDSACHTDSFVHTFNAKGAYYYVSAGVPRIFGALIVKPKTIFNIELTDKGFSADIFGVEVGDTVIWHWSKCTVNHNIVQVEYKDSDFKLVTARNGFRSGSPVSNTGKFAHVFATVGTFYYVSNGLEGQTLPSIIVVRPKTTQYEATVTDTFIQPNVLVVNVGDTVMWTWRNCNNRHNIYGKPSFDTEGDAEDSNNRKQGPLSVVARAREMMMASEETSKASATRSPTPFYSGPAVSTSGAFLHTFMQPGMFQYQSSGIPTATTAMVLVLPTPSDVIIRITDSGYQPHVRTISAGDRVWWVWDEDSCQQYHNVIEMYSRGNKFQRCDNGFQSGPANRRTGVFVWTFAETGVFHFSSDGTADLVASIVVIPSSQQVRVIVSDDGFDPPKFNIHEGDTVWFTWAGIENKNKRHNVFQVMTPKFGDLSPIADGFRSLGGPIYSGGYKHTFHDVGVFKFASQNTDGHGAVIVEPRSNFNNIVVTDNGPNPDILIISVNDTVWWLWEKCVERQNVLQICRPPLSALTLQQLKTDGFGSGPAIYRSGVFVHRFIHEGLYFYQSDASISRYGTIIVDPWVSRNHIYVTSTGFSVTSIMINCGESVYWTWDGTGEQHTIVQVMPANAYSDDETSNSDISVYREPNRVEGGFHSIPKPDITNFLHSFQEEGIYFFTTLGASRSLTEPLMGVITVLEETEISEQPVININGGVISTKQPIVLSPNSASSSNVPVSIDTDSTVIYYTTDGQRPTTASQIFKVDRPILLDETCYHIRAMSMQPGIKASDIFTSQRFLVISFPELWVDMEYTNAHNSGLALQWSPLSISAAETIQFFRIYINGRQYGSEISKHDTTTVIPERLAECIAIPDAHATETNLETDTHIENSSFIQYYHVVLVADLLDSMAGGAMEVARLQWPMELNRPYINVLEQDSVNYVFESSEEKGAREQQSDLLSTGESETIASYQSCGTNSSIEDDVTDQCSDIDEIMGISSSKGQKEDSESEKTSSEADQSVEDSIQDEHRVQEDDGNSIYKTGDGSDHDDDKTYEIDDIIDDIDGINDDVNENAHVLKKALESKDKVANAAAEEVTQTSEQTRDQRDVVDDKHYDSSPASSLLNINTNEVGSSENEAIIEYQGPPRTVEKEVSEGDLLSENDVTTTIAVTPISSNKNSSNASLSEISTGSDELFNIKDTTTTDTVEPSLKISVALQTDDIFSETGSGITEASELETVYVVSANALPSRLRATRIDCTRIHIAWLSTRNSSNNTQLNTVDKCNIGNIIAEDEITTLEIWVDGKKHATIGKDETTFVITNLSPGHSYAVHLSVNTLNAVGTTDPVEFTCTLLPVIPVPDLQFVRETGTTIAVAWLRPPPEDEALYVVDYLLKWRAVDDSDSSLGTDHNYCSGSLVCGETKNAFDEFGSIIAEDDSPNCEATISGLFPGVTYSIDLLQRTCESSNHQCSKPLVIQTLRCPDPPSLRLVSVKSDSVIVEWSSEEDDDDIITCGSSVVGGYEACINDNESKLLSTVRSISNNGPFKGEPTWRICVAGEPRQSISVKVRAILNVDDIGVANWSSPICATLLGQPDPPKVSLYDLGDETATVSWTPGATFGVEATGWDIRVNGKTVLLNGGFVPHDVTHFTLSTTKGVECFVTVSPLLGRSDIPGTPPVSETLTIVGVGVDKPELRTGEITATSVTVLWSPPKCFGPIKIHSFEALLFRDSDHCYEENDSSPSFSSDELSTDEDVFSLQPQRNRTVKTSTNEATVSKPIAMESVRVGKHKTHRVVFDSLIPGMAYRIFVRVRVVPKLDLPSGGIGGKVSSKALHFTTSAPPTIPIVAVRNVTANAATLFWQPSVAFGDATVHNYVIRMNGMVIRQLQSEETECRIDGLLPATTSSFTVQATTNHHVGHSAESSVIEVEPPGLQRPDVTVKTLSPDGRQCVLTWPAIVTYGDLTVRSLLVRWWAEGDAQWLSDSESSLSPNASEFTLVDLEPQRSYNATVTAIPEPGLGVEDTSSNTVAIAMPGAPDPPLLVAEATGLDRIGLSWTTPRQYSSARIERYIIKLNGEILCQDVDPIATSWELTGLDPRTAFTISLTAVAGEFESTSATVEVSTPGVGEVLIRARSCGDQILISWPQPNLEGEVFIRGYTVEWRKIFLSPNTYSRSTSSHTMSERRDIEAADTIVAKEYIPIHNCSQLFNSVFTFTIRPVIPRHSYDVRVIAFVEAGAKRDINIRSNWHRIDIAAPPDAPVLSIVSVFPSRFRLAWTASRSYGDSEVIGYQVYVGGQPYGELVPADQQNINILATPSNQYSIFVLARSIHPTGDSVASNVVTVTTPELERLVLKKKVSVNTISLSWNRPKFSHAGINATVHSYELEYSSFDRPRVKKVVISGQVLNYLISDCTPGHKYLVVLSAIAEGHNEVVTSKQLVIETPAPPNAPILSIENVTVDSVTVAWSRSRSYGSASVIGYEISVNGVAVAEIDPEIFRYTMHDCKPARQYSIKVRAMVENKRIGGSAYSAPLHVTCSSAIVPIVKRVPSFATDAVRIQWTRPTVQAPIILKGFIVYWTRLPDTKCSSNSTAVVPNNKHHHGPLPPNQTTFQVTGLRRNTEYSMLVVAILTSLDGQEDVTLKSDELIAQTARSPQPPVVKVTINDLPMKKRKNMTLLATALVNERERLLKSLARLDIVAMDPDRHMGSSFRLHKEDLIRQKGFHRLAQIEDYLVECLERLNSPSAPMRVTLQWEPSKDDGDALVTGYQLFVDGKPFGKAISCKHTEADLILKASSKSDHTVAIVATTDHVIGNMEPLSPIIIPMAKWKPFLFQCTFDRHQDIVNNDTDTHNKCLSYREALAQEMQERPIGGIVYGVTPHFHSTSLGTYDGSSTLKRTRREYESFCKAQRRRQELPSIDVTDITTGDTMPLKQAARELSKAIFFWSLGCDASISLLQRLKDFSIEHSGQEWIVHGRIVLCCVSESSPTAVREEIKRLGIENESIFFYHYTTAPLAARESAELRYFPTFLFADAKDVVRWQGCFRPIDYSHLSAFIMYRFGKILPLDSQANIEGELFKRYIPDVSQLQSLLHNGSNKEKKRFNIKYDNREADKSLVAAPNRKKSRP